MSDPSSEAPTGPYPTPPYEFTDAAGREIHIRVAGDGPLDAEGEFEALVEMYDAFDPADRAQGIPPTRADTIREWLDDVLASESINVLAWYREQVVGHATLVSDGEQGYELAIFVLQTYQRAGIGSQLLRCLLGEGLTQGIERVWLTVERWNRSAIELYRKVGFETTEAESFELVMALQLNPAGIEI